MGGGNPPDADSCSDGGSDNVLIISGSFLKNIITTSGIMANGIYETRVLGFSVIESSYLA